MKKITDEHVAVRTVRTALMKSSFRIPLLPSLTSVQRSLSIPIFVLDLVGLEDATTPYEPASLNFVKLINLIKFKTCEKPYKKGNLVNSINLINVFLASVKGQFSESEWKDRDM